MDNKQFGGFIAQLRKEQGLTQKELADKLNVTDKAVSKWETAKGFPDVKLLEPLAQALGVSLVELMQGRRREAETLTVAEADAAVSHLLRMSGVAVALRPLCGKELAVHLRVVGRREGYRRRRRAYRDSCRLLPYQYDLGYISAGRNPAGFADRLYHSGH